MALLRFSRGQFPEPIFDKVNGLLAIESPKDLEILLKSYGDGTRKLPRWEFEEFNPAALLGYEHLATRPLFLDQVASKFRNSIHVTRIVSDWDFLRQAFGSKMTGSANLCFRDWKHKTIDVLELVVLWQDYCSVWR